MPASKSAKGRKVGREKRKGTHVGQVGYARTAKNKAKRTKKHQLAHPNDKNIIGAKIRRVKPINDAKKERTKHADKDTNHNDNI